MHENDCEIRNYWYQKALKIAVKADPAKSGNRIGSAANPQEHGVFGLPTRSAETIWQHEQWDFRIFIEKELTDFDCQLALFLAPKRGSTPPNWSKAKNHGKIGIWQSDFIVYGGLLCPEKFCVNMNGYH